MVDGRESRVTLRILARHFYAIPILGFPEPALRISEGCANSPTLSHIYESLWKSWASAKSSGSARGLLYTRSAPRRRAHDPADFHRLDADFERDGPSAHVRFGQ